jgi:hypothetical protein
MFIMEWLFKWGGECFGYRDNDNLRTHDGRHVGKFHGDEIYGPDGQYLGEITSEPRLISNKSKKIGKKILLLLMEVGLDMLNTLIMKAMICMLAMKIFRICKV